MKESLKDISLVVSWREIAKVYFGKSSSWLYHKLEGIDGNGGEGGFSESEKQTLRNALRDLSRRLEEAAKRV